MTGRAPGARQGQGQRWLARAGLLLLLHALGACRTTPEQALETAPLVAAEDTSAQPGTLEPDAGASSAEALPRTRFLPTPPSVLERERVTNLAAPPAVPVTGEPVTLALDAVPLPAAINEIYGNLLGLTFQLDPAIRGASDLVSLRIPEPVTPQELLDIAGRVLADYGVGVVRDGPVLRFELDADGRTGRPPLLVSGRTLPDVPISHRTVFQVFPFEVVGVNVAQQLAQNLLREQNVDLKPLPFANAMLLSGSAAAVEAGAAMLALLDRPSMKGRHSIRIEPVFLDAAALAERLIEVLKAEGYAASERVDFSAAITVLGMEEVGAVFVFAASPESLLRARQWAESLDRPGTISGGQAIYYYPVQRTSAFNLRDVLVQMLGGSVPAQRQAANRGAVGGTGAAGRQGGNRGAPAGATLLGDQSLVVDEVRNALVFRGTSEQWYSLLPVIRQMDQPAKQVLIEVLVAEVTLTDELRSGFEWFARGGIGDYDGAGGTLGGLGVGGAGLVYTFDNAGEVRARLNAFAREDRVTILSSPRIMVKSGEPAFINVGTEVPLITSQSTAADLGVGNSILQEVQYRTTGVRLEITPLIHSGNQVDVLVVQEVSEAQPNDVSSVPSPTIFNRAVSTNLTLRDGGSVLLGGLISRNLSSGETGIPGLKDLPLVGRAFRVEGQTDIRTELMVLLTPYVLDSAAEAEKATEAFRRRLGEVDPLLRPGGGGPPP